MLDYNAVKNWDFGKITQTYTRRDTMLYGLGIGIGSDPLDDGQLRFVYEKNLLAVPTMAAVLGSPGFWLSNYKTGANWVKLVQGEQHVHVHKPLPVEATIVARNRVLSVTDKGPEKGAIIVIQRDIHNQATSELLAQNKMVTFLRGDGGYSEYEGRSDPGPEALPAVPERQPDTEVELASLPQAALIYRLSGDYNTLHADPDVAKAAGFERPILHGLCTYGMAAHAVLKTCSEYNPLRIRNMAVRFTSPVYPGEKVRFQIWRESDTRLRLRARIDARDVVVLNNGIVELG
jgi:acyl dehydratase